MPAFLTLSKCLGNLFASENSTTTKNFEEIKPNFINNANCFQEEFNIFSNWYSLITTFFRQNMSESMFN